MRAVRYIVLGGAVAASLLAAAARADVVTLNNGQTYEGTIQNRNSEGFDLRITVGPFTTIKHINIMDIADIAPSPIAPPPAPPAPASATSGRAAPPLAATAPPAATQPASTEPSHFFLELAQTALGDGPDRLDRLPENLQAEWAAALRSEALGDRPQTLQLLYKMADDFHAIPHGQSRLDAITRREKKMSFGQWEAHIHWDAIYSRARGPSLDVGPVHEEEKEPLIGLLKEKTDPALLPLKPYFPRTDPKTGRPLPFKPQQLSGINVSNCEKIKDQAIAASQILLAQLKVQPDMPGPDRALLAGQLQTVNRILARATELEPQARAAQERAARQQRAAEERNFHLNGMAR
ncbi:MAG TPA: hypothetical protein VH253_00740 [Phycisphaerae bacterium]|nr:hypothetical protein [Phycisphaerae bacterium]